MALTGRTQRAGKGMKGKQPGLLGRGDSARLQREFQRVSSNLELQLVYFGGGGARGRRAEP